MSPGASNFDKFGPPNLRSSAPVKRQTRSAYAQLPATSPRKTMASLNTSPRKKKPESRFKKSPEKPVLIRETEILTNQMSLMVHTDVNEGPSSSSASSVSAASTSGVPEKSVGKETVDKTKKGRRNLNPVPASEFYSKKPYRAVSAGEDIDPDKDEPDIPNCSRQAKISDTWRPEYCAGTQELAHPESIPKMIVIEDDFVLEPKSRFVAPLKRIYCNDQPEYIDLRHYEKVEAKEPVHYEVTAHDMEFIRTLNETRILSNGEEYLSLEMFCKIIKALEIDAFKNIHNHLLDALHVVYTRQQDNEDQECDVCRISDCDVSDDMVFCDMCNTCVHMLCAGLLKLPDPSAPWKCPKCEYTKTPAYPCALCPALGGSMTYNSTKTEWAHHSCALFIPEIIFENEEERAPITNFDKIAPERFSQLCTICDTRQGACVTCSQPDCEETYHVCCALRAGCTVRIQEIPNDPEHNVIRLTHCHRHSNARDIIVEDAYRSHKNPWLSKIEQYFFVMTNYEKLAESMHIQEIMVSDIYEFWKQKRMRMGGPLIPHLHDHIQLEPVITRVAEKAQSNLDHMINKAGISIGTLPHCVDLEKNQFFPPAALMVTELRQMYLKRADEAIQRDKQMLTMIEEREMMKRKEVLDEMQTFRVAGELLKRGTVPEEVLGLMKVSKAEIRKAQSPKAFAEFLRKIEGVQEEPMSPLKRKLHPKFAKPLEISIPHQKSPLRPRNNGSPVAQKASTSSAGVQNSSPAPKRSRMPAKKLHY